MEKIYTAEEIRNRHKEPSLLPPVIANLLSGKTAIFHEAAGTVWLRVNSDVTSSDVNHGWERWESKNKFAPIKEDYKSWIIPSSRNGVYEVILRHGVFSCSCAGFGFRRKCSHIEQAKNIYSKES